MTRVAAAYVACLAFAVSYLLTTWFGGSGLTAVFRGGVVALVTLFLGRLVIGPAISAILDAMARDSAIRTAQSKEDE
ncbi:MAG: hypothetical protein KDC87_13155 [Planctomycetes bacterium]|nr:hypothetical protein [Planctomycetota bacterium]MCB9872001.1 hypothetical protein [Planctomycetota bacterium]MCB9888406.1 hypothetical protein [Planctomycetota bacterium]